jgi:hypothetical protein
MITAPLAQLDNAYRCCDRVMSTGSMLYARQQLINAMVSLEAATEHMPEHQELLFKLVGLLDAGWDRIGWPPDDLIQEVMGGIADLRAELTGPRLA